MILLGKIERGERKQAADGGSKSELDEFKTGGWPFLCGSAWEKSESAVASHVP
jgi:hypothetical protein